MGSMCPSTFFSLFSNSLIQFSLEEHWKDSSLYIMLSHALLSKLQLAGFCTLIKPANPIMAQPWLGWSEGLSKRAWGEIKRCFFLIKILKFFLKNEWTWLNGFYFSTLIQTKTLHEAREMGKYINIHNIWIIWLCTELGDAWWSLPSKCLTIPRRLLPWAAMSTRLPFLIMGAISSFQKGKARAMVSFKLSQAGSSPGFSPAYLRSCVVQKTEDNG